MIHYFIDFENVHETGFAGVEAISEPAVIHVIYSGAQHKMPLKFFSGASSLLVSWTFELACNGVRDALDIQLGVYLGMTMAKCPDDSYYIVSADKGYDSAIDSLRQKGFTISRQLNIRGDLSQIEQSEQSEQSEPPAPTPEQNAQKIPSALNEIGEQIRKLIPTELCNNDKITQISALIFSSSKLVDVYRGVVRIAGGFKTGGQAYGSIKTYVNDYFKNKAENPEMQQNENIKVTAVQLRQYLSVQECPDEMLELVVNSVNNATKLQQVSPQINKAFGNNTKKGSAIYKKIKPLVKTLFQD